MRLLCLDLGQKRIGLALSDESELIASPLGAILVRDSEQVFDRVTILAKENEVGKVVIGLPLQLNGKEGIESARARNFGTELENRLHLPVAYMDERLTSVSADRILLQAGQRRDKRRANIDATAAAIILQTYLDMERNRQLRLPR